MSWIAVALIAVLVGIAAYAMFAGSQAPPAPHAAPSPASEPAPVPSPTTDEAAASPSVTAAADEVPVVSAPMDGTPPTADDRRTVPPGLFDEPAPAGESEDDEELETVQASPEELARLRAELKRDD